MRFAKYHGLGNDYVVLPGIRGASLDPDIVQRVCDRHRGVGADGILTDEGRDGDDAAVRIFNPDGSEAEKSGNGLRIFARFLWDERRVGADGFVVRTKGGDVRCEVRDDGRFVFVEMGRATFASNRIPMTGPVREVVSEPLDVDGRTFSVTAVSVGNPHCVVPLDAISENLAREIGPVIERHPAFPNRTNVQLLSERGRHRIAIEIWERGAGYTLASGSSSCAAAAAAIRLGLAASPLVVEMPGGELEITVAGDWEITMLGPVAKVAEGDIAREVFDG